MSNYEIIRIDNQVVMMGLVLDTEDRSLGAV